MIMTKRYELCNVSDPAPKQLDNIVPDFGELILRPGATSNSVYLSGSYSGALSENTRYSLPLDTPTRLKLSNANLLWAYCNTTSSVPLDLITEIDKSA